MLCPTRDVKLYLDPRYTSAEVSGNDHASSKKRTLEQADDKFHVPEKAAKKPKEATPAAGAPKPLSEIQKNKLVKQLEKIGKRVAECRTMTAEIEQDADLANFIPAKALANKHHICTLHHPEKHHVHIRKDLFVKRGHNDNNSAYNNYAR